MARIEINGTVGTIYPTHREMPFITQFIKKHCYQYSYTGTKPGGAELKYKFALEYRDHITVHSNLAIQLADALENESYPVTLNRPTMHTVRKVDYQLQDHIVPRGYQEHAINHLLKIDDNPSKGICLPPGKGKTLTYLAYLSRSKNFCLGIFRPTYVDQWVKVLPKTLNIDPNRIAAIQGGDNLMDLFDDLLTDGELPYDIVLISNKTMQKYVMNHLHGKKKYPFSPAEFVARAGFGNLLIDEVHEDLNFNYLLMCSIAVPLVTGLSGTWFNKDRFVASIQETMIPKEAVYDFLVDKPYIKYVEMKYFLPWGSNVKTSFAGMGSYNHIAFEEWLIKRPKILFSYLNLVGAMVEKVYMKRRVEGDKVVIFSASLELVKVLSEYLEERLPMEVKVISFTGGSAYDDLLENDAISTTPGKSGTGVDIPGLTTVINGYMTASWQKVVQMMGRLRETPDRDMIFIQLLCGDIEKHEIYQRDNRMVIDPRVSDYKQLVIKSSLG